jgi:beta-glucosidase-like glycosyl hydrolase
MTLLLPRLAYGVLVLATLGAAAAPNYHGCLTNTSRRFAYCNFTLTDEERARSLIQMLTLEEKVGLISPDPGMGDTCFANIHGIPRVELPPYGWLVECNTGVASQCLGPEKCATTFPGPTGLGASFDRDLWSAKGQVMSTEMRAFSNANWHRGISGPKPSLIGTSAFGPNLSA